MNSASNFRPLGIWSASFPWLLGLSAALSACGAPAEVAKPPEPTKVVWGQGDDGDAPAEGAASGDEGDEEAAPGEVDLDAPVAESEPAKKKKSAPAKPEPQPEPEPERESKKAPPPEPAPEPKEEPAASPMPLAKEMRAAMKAKAKASPPEKRPEDEEEPPPKEEPVVTGYKGANACKAARFSIPRVKEACENGGRVAAKAVMKEAVNKALAAGSSLKCGDCHAEQKEYTLKKNAVAELEKWLGT
jgi:hypothetical protein